MKKIRILIIFLLLYSIAFAQQPGVERHFHSYKYNFVENTDDRMYGDTLTDNFHNFLPQQKITHNPLGYTNPGQPFVVPIFSMQPKQNEFWFLNNYYPYIKNHRDALFFDARKPYTLFEFNGGEKVLDNAAIFHTQNLGSSFNFAFDYDLVNSKGHYMYNDTKVHAMNFTTAYTKHKYQSHLSLIFNTINNRENGGIKSEEAFEESKTRAPNLDVNLHDSYNKISQLGFNYNHEYRFGHYDIDTVYEKKDTLLAKTLNSKFSIMHDITFDRYYRIYTDNSKDFYENYYYNAGNTKDSTRLHYLENKLLLNLNLNTNGLINKFQVMAGAKNRTYYYVYNSDYNTGARFYSSTYLTGLLRLKTNKSLLDAELNYCLLGREIFDFDVNAKFSQKISDFLSFNAFFKFELKTPYIFYNYFNSNNFFWANPELAKTNNIGGKIDFSLDKWKLNAGTNINTIHNYMVFDSLAMPKQIDKLNFIADIYVKNLLRLGNFYWFNQLTYQFIYDKENLPLPEFVAYSNIYFKRPLFKNALVLQIGIDMKYHTNIYGYGYMPSTEAFYLQDNKKFGNYPYFSTYVTAQIKKFRAFVKLGNINSFIMDRTYYSLYKIPDNPFSFNFGISWEFYD
ncbi:putative porin [Bacteroidales bacterium OttesenSCG-928-I21]|nr:putative porin [Bacteroidales bacterium OttesenSCG-928-I21]